MVLFVMVAGIAVAALAGWMLTLGMLTRALLPMANALSVCQKIVDREDEKVFSLAERALKKRQPQPAANEPRRPDEVQQPYNPMAAVFGTDTDPIDEQPDAADGRLEIREA